MRGSRKRRSIALAVLALIAIGVAAAILLDDDGSPAVSKVEGCTLADAPETKDVSYEAPPQTVKPSEKLTAMVETSCGDFEIALDPQRAPKTVNSFVFLAEEGFYDGLDFNRIVSGFLVQGGDPSGEGGGNAGYTLIEKPPADTAYQRGVVAMARELTDPPGQSGSQFFVTTSTETGLPPDYALLGEVSEGYGTVARIDELGDSQEEPEQTVLIEKVTIKRG